MSQIFNIEGDKVVINKLALKQLEGAITHEGKFNVTDSVLIGKTLTVEGTITADTIKVKNLVTEQGSLEGAGQWSVNLEDDLNGKGFSWTWGNGTTNLMYRTGNRLWTNGDFDLDADRSYKINNAEVLSANALGSQVVKSNLREIGTLKTLSVTGDSFLSEFAFFNSGFGRLGLNTETPKATLSIVDNGIEIIAGSPDQGRAQIGTYTNHNLEIITDNTARVTINNNGTVVFGNEATKTANVIVYGTLKVETLIADTRVERSSPLEFKATRDVAIYGRGLVWSGTGDARQLIMMADPDRLWSTESLDLKEGQAYYIGGQPVLAQNNLGAGVTGSKLTSVGVLSSLEVQGETKLYGDLNASFGITKFKTGIFNDGVNWLNITSSRVNTSGNISINVAEDEVYYADKDEIAIGNKNNTRRPVKVYGPVSLGINNPDPTVDLAVKGDISFADKKFTTGSLAPTEGTFSKGDICWNNNPASDSYIGWVCVQEGTPGVWLPFGAIGRQ